VKLRKLCFHGLDERQVTLPPEFRVVASTIDRNALRTAMGTEEIAALVIDLDARDAFDVIVEMLEIRPGISVIGVTSTDNVNRIIMAQRAGCKQLTPKPLDPADLVAALRRALEEFREAVTLGKTIAVIGTSGGAGATTIACYLAMALANDNSTVAIVDADFEFGTVAKAWDLSPRFTIHDLMVASEADRQHLEDFLIELRSGISVLPRPEKIEQAHGIDEAAMRGVLDSVRNSFNYVVVDLPRKLDDVTGCVIERCEHLLMVVQLTVAGIVNAARIHDALQRHDVPPEKIEFVINRHCKNVHTLDVDALEDRLRRKVFGIVPNQYKTLSAAADLGQLVDERNPVRKAIADMARKLTGREPTPAPSRWLPSLRFGG
jgi:pilus assembly protein CpaE